MKITVDSELFRQATDRAEQCDLAEAELTRLRAELDRVTGEATALAEANQKFADLVRAYAEDLTRMTGERAALRGKLAEVCRFAERTLAEPPHHNGDGAALMAICDLATPQPSAPAPDLSQPEHGDVPEGSKCSDCPPFGWITNTTRCAECPLLDGTGRAQ